MPQTFDQLRELVEHGLIEHLPFSRMDAAERLNEALRYAVFPGGKRLRPVLALLGARMVGGSVERALPAACGVEFLHTSSLIFDDLPAMDDADVRRGNPALHLVYGEDLALLAGLALMNQSYALFGRSPALIAEAAACIGMNGMIGGQAVDLDIGSGNGSAQPFSERNRKTSALMRLTFTAGAIACDGSASDIGALAQAGECLGEAYQVCDDLLDQFRDCEYTGKTCHQDARHNRPSHAAEYGPEACQAHVQDLVRKAKRSLTDRFGSTTPATAMLTQIDGIVREFSRAGLVSACS